MRPALLAALLCVSACASIPLPTAAPHGDLSASNEVDVCVLWGAREDRRRYEGVAELSLEPWHMAYATVVIQHPYGLVVVDPPFSSAVEEDLAAVPPWFRIISGSAAGKTPVATGLREVGLEPAAVRDVLLTHSHWDHTGGIRDLPNARIRMSKAELEFFAPLTRYIDHGAMPHLLTPALHRVRTFELEGPAVLRFESSHDLFGDGAIVAVPLPGHTPGSVGYLVRGRGGKRWLLSGDATWTVRGIELPAHKLASVIDADAEQTSASIGLLHVLRQEHPEIVIVPAHDADALETMPTCKAP